MRAAAAASNWFATCSETSWHRVLLSSSSANAALPASSKPWSRECTWEGEEEEEEEEGHL